MNVLVIQDVDRKIDKELRDFLKKKYVPIIPVIDYAASHGQYSLYDSFRMLALENEVDFIIGFGYGGYLAACIGDDIGLPTMSFNTYVPDLRSSIFVRNPYDDFPSNDERLVNNNVIHDFYYTTSNQENFLHLDTIPDVIDTCLDYMNGLK